MASLELQKAVQGYEKFINNHGIEEQLIDAYVLASAAAFNEKDDIPYALKVSNRAKEIINLFTTKNSIGDIWAIERYQQDSGSTPFNIVEQYYELLKNESIYRFESFMLYMEKKRYYQERFYQPRMNPLTQVAQLIQDLYDDKLDEGMVFCPGRVGKTQIVKMGNLWFGSNRPERSNLYSAYSDKITGGFYDGTNELITDPTYTYAELYPQNVSKKIITDGKDLTIDLVRKKTYPTFTMRSIYGTNCIG